ncbi:MAG: hypothetical protein JWO36_1760 [Myxococcales bacterium]|nr:hypothetical protein [Myxococcales bacterium]
MLLPFPELSRRIARFHATGRFSVAQHHSNPHIREAYESHGQPPLVRSRRSSPIRVVQLQRQGSDGVGASSRASSHGTGSSAAQAAHAATPTTSTGDAVAQPAASAGTGKLDGTALTTVRCRISGLGSEFKRSLQVDAHGTIYVFDDSRHPHKIVAGTGPCGLTSGGDVAGDSFAFAADGSVVAAALNGAEESCKARHFQTFDWRGAVASGLAYHVDGGQLAVDDLVAKPCTSRPFSKDLPQGRISQVSANAAEVLLVDFHASGNAENAVWRYKPDGTLIDKVGLKPGGTDLGWIGVASPCADGVCAEDSGVLFVYDHAGKRIATHPIKTGLGVDVKWGEIVDLVEVGRHSLYALINYSTPNDDKGADLVRIDGIYAK